MALENDFLAGALGRIVPFTGASRGWPGVAYGHRAIELTHDLPVRRQAELLNISRANVYYLPRPISTVDLALMRRIDELHLNFPFAGARMLRDRLKLEGFKVGRKHVRTLMDKMGIVALYRKPHTSAPHPAHRIYPYLLKNLVIERPNQVWATDITYIPMKRGFMFLVAILDWATRRVLAHRVSTSMSTDFCVEALEEAIAKYGRPQIFNTDGPMASPPGKSVHK